MTLKDCKSQSAHVTLASETYATKKCYWAFGLSVLPFFVFGQSFNGGSNPFVSKPTSLCVLFHRFTAHCFQMNIISQKGKTQTKQMRSHLILLIDVFWKKKERFFNDCH